jgi:SAM-dependent methyltransferase
MNLPQEILRLLRCPACGSPLSAAGSGLACQSSPGHAFAVEEGFLTLAKPPVGKYDPGYAARYAALWAFGYQTLHSGLDEPLYRAVSSLAAEALAARPRGNPPAIVDCGCGVGRVAADCAALAPDGVVLGLDGSLAMLELAERIVRGSQEVDVDLSAYGFGTLAIPARARENVWLVRADVEDLPVADGCADLALSVNVIDRLPHGPDRAFAECHRILRPGGCLLFTNPLNWTEGELWKKYGRGEAILRLLERVGFHVETWFDDLAYREILDRRGSFEEFTTLVALARKSGSDS